MTLGPTPYAALVCLVEPAGEPVTLAEAKNWLRVDGTADDDALARLVRQGRELVEELALRQLVTATWRARYRWSFPTSITLPRPPLVAVVAVRGRRGGQAVTLDPSEYDVGDSGGFGRLALAPLAGLDDVGPDSELEVEFTCGTAVEQVPARAKDAILAYCAARYAQRESAELPRGFYDLVDTFRWSL